MASALTEAQIKDLELQYVARLNVPNADEYTDKSTRRSARVRKSLECHLDIPYGDTAGQRLDIFPAKKSGAPVHIFIHGGYWRNPGLTKDTYSHMAAPMVAAGAAVVLPNYDLCPTVSITEIVRQTRCAVIWVYRNIAKYRGDPKQIYVSGHSAGGHLTAMMMATDWSKEGRLPKGLIKGTAALSGLFDIVPHRRLEEFQKDLHITATEVKTMSPMHLPPIAKGPAIVALGGDETHLWHWQSLAYAAHLRKHRIAAEFIATPGDHHFDITDRLGNARDPLTRALIAQMGL
jgi:arylformamidase